jgi:cytochrome bd-type quinol oxidase subunit 2
MIAWVRTYLERRRAKRTGLWSLVVTTVFLLALISITVINISINSKIGKEEIEITTYILMVLPVFIAVYMLYKRKKFAPYVEKYNISYVYTVMFLPVVFYIIFVFLAKQGYFNDVERIAFSTGILFFICCMVLYNQIKFYIKRRKEIKKKDEL